MAIKFSVQNGGTPQLSGLTPGEFVEVRIQDTGRGGYKVYRCQADAAGQANVAYPNFDNGKAVTVRELVPDGQVHSLVFTPDSTAQAINMVDAASNAPPNPSPVLVANESLFQKLENLAGAITGTTTAPLAQKE